MRRKKYGNVSRRRRQRNRYRKPSFPGPNIVREGGGVWYAVFGFFVCLIIALSYGFALFG
jgi:hypothetical protein